MWVTVLISSVKLDFKIAMWLGFRALSLVPNVPPFTIKECNFHFCQALLRKLVNLVMIFVEHQLSQSLIDFFDYFKYQWILNFNFHIDD